MEVLEFSPPRQPLRLVREVFCRRTFRESLRGGRTCAEQLPLHLLCDEGYGAVYADNFGGVELFTNAPAVVEQSREPRVRFQMVRGAQFDDAAVAKFFRLDQPAHALGSFVDAHLVPLFREEICGEQPRHPSPHDEGFLRGGIFRFGVYEKAHAAPGRCRRARRTGGDFSFVKNLYVIYTPKTPRSTPPRRKPRTSRRYRARRTTTRGLARPATSGWARGTVLSHFCAPPTSPRTLSRAATLTSARCRNTPHPP